MRLGVISLHATIHLNSILLVRSMINKNIIARFYIVLIIKYELITFRTGSLKRRKYSFFVLMHLGCERVVAARSSNVSFTLDVVVICPVRHDHWNVTWPYIVPLLVILVVT